MVNCGTKGEVQKLREQLAAAIPGAGIRESGKQRIAYELGKTPITIMELLEAATSVRARLTDLDAALSEAR
jgi:hypothetical protein